MLDLAPKMFREAWPTDTAGARGDRMATSRTSQGLWFHRPSGSMLACPDFTLCQVWNKRGLTSQNEFDGRPWLMLALWGHLAQRDGALLHGAVCAIRNRYVMLLGDQQVGKSTLGGLIAEAGHGCLTDEYPLLSWTEGSAWAHGTPWPGSVGDTPAVSGPLAAIFFLRQAPSDVLKPLSPREGGKLLLNNARFFTWDPTTTLPTVELLDRTAQSVPIYEFGFAPTPKAVELLQEAL